ncbi:VOC family protein [Micromonospora inositola]|uniref:VOC family protein n=1 Tax=Micromonospora inositola TaxID=47865 RepID=UPI00155F72C7
MGCDADDPQRIAAFWALALGYVKESGFDEPDNASIVDLDGRGPAIGFLKVPQGNPDEPRTGHHLDLVPTFGCFSAL